MTYQIHSSQTAEDHLSDFALYALKAVIVVMSLSGEFMRSGAYNFWWSRM